MIPYPDQPPWISGLDAFDAECPGRRYDPAYLERVAYEGLRLCGLTLETHSPAPGIYNHTLTPDQARPAPCLAHPDKEAAT